ncbi:hypothetical protein ACNKHS_17365 [Shigella flexneri]
MEDAEGELVVLENVRFNKGEKKDDETLSKNTLPCATYSSWMHRYGSPYGLYPRYR